MKQADAIITSDFHIRDTIPECRSDDFFKAQATKYEFIKKLQKKHECHVLVGGDVFENWKPSPALLSKAFSFMPENVLAIPGQHDLPAHSLENISKSGINTLAAGGSIQTFSKDHGFKNLFYTKEDDCVVHVYGFPWGVELQNTEPSDTEYKIAVIHKLIYKGKEPFPGAERIGSTAKALIKKMSGFDLIITGDNHQTFIEEYKGTLLVNAGSLMRTTAAQVDHKPCVFLWYAEDNEVEQVFLPINKKAITREHIDLKKERDEKDSVFIERLNEDIDISEEFKNNLNKYLAANEIDERVLAIIREATDG